MEVKELAEMVLEKLEDHGAYFDVDKKKIKQSIAKHLNKTYRIEVEYAIMKIEMAEAEGKKLTKKQYSNYFKVVEGKTIEEAERVAVVEKKELQNFI